MLTDDIRIKNPQRPVLDRVSTLSENNVEGALVFLTQQDGSNEPGVYFRDAESWVYLKEEQLKFLARYLPTVDSHYRNGNSTPVVAIKEDGTLAVWGTISAAVNSVPEGEFLTVSVNSDFACAVRVDGTLTAWGIDTADRVTDCPTDGDYVSVTTSNGSVTALKADGSLVTWGTFANEVVTDVPSGVPFKAIYGCHANNMFALTSDGTIYGWGDSSDLTEVPSGNGFVQVAAGGSVGYALRNNGEVVGFGQDIYNTIPDAPSTAVYIDGYQNSFCAIMEDGSVYTWGQNTYDTSAWIDTKFIVATQSGIIGMNSRGEIYSVGTGNSITQMPMNGKAIKVVAGYNRIVALKESGRVYAWGSINTPIASSLDMYSDYIDVAASTYDFYALRSNGRVVSSSNAPTSVSSYFNSSSDVFTKISAGHYNVIALKDDGTIVVAGTDSYGEISDIPSGTFIDVGICGDTCLAIRDDGTLVAWGYNNHNQLGVPSGTFTRLANGTLGVDHCAAIRTSGELEVWGSDSNGVVSNKPSGTFKSISLISFACLAVRTDGTVEYWGHVAWGVDITSEAMTGVVSCALAAGYTSCFIMEDGTTEVRGYLNYGLETDRIAIPGFLLPY